MHFGHRSEKHRHLWFPILSFSSCSSGYFKLLGDKQFYNNFIPQRKMLNQRMFSFNQIKMEQLNSEEKKLFIRLESSADRTQPENGLIQLVLRRLSSKEAECNCGQARQNAVTIKLSEHELMLQAKE